jgi:uncharacterized membrane protein YuzA (DUF378 family)
MKVSDKSKFFLYYEVEGMKLILTLKGEKMKCINVIALILVVIGALNWGLWGFFQFDFVAYVFGGSMAGWSRIIYGIIGLAGLWSLSFFARCCKACCGQCCCSSCHTGKKGGSCKM